MKLFVFLGLLSLAFADFSGDQVLTLYPRHAGQVEVLKRLDNVDFWHPDGPEQVRINDAIDIRITSEQLTAFKVMMARHRIDFEVKIDDVQILVDNQLSHTSRGLLKKTIYENYYNLDETNTWIDEVVSTHSVASKMVIGTSFENRPINMIKISTNDNNPAILVDCAFHAREWISPKFCQCYVDQLLNGNDQRTGMDPILNKLTVYVVPVINVDGYDYTWNGNDDNARMWRKTRSTGNGVCIGVDPNRNCDADWSGPGSSGNTCSDTYYGPYVESESEVKALANFVRSHIGEIKNYVTFHSYGQYILYPYSYTRQPAAANSLLDYHASLARDAVKQRYRTRYTYGPGGSTLYPAAGGSDDFSYDAGVPLAYTVELRDNGAYGFLLPESQIREVCYETYDLMGVMHSAALDMK